MGYVSHAPFTGSIFCCAARIIDNPVGIFESSGKECLGNNVMTCFQKV